MFSMRPLFFFCSIPSSGFATILEQMAKIGLVPARDEVFAQLGLD